MNAPATAARWIATWFGLGHAPLAPGTFGALGALPLHFLLKRTHPALHFATTVALGALGTWAGNELSRELDEEDPQSVVVDEVVGTLIALGLVSDRGIVAEALAWLAFRALDIAKPGPIHSVQRLKPPGVGIMADDVLAGLAAGLGVRLLFRR